MQSKVSVDNNSRKSSVGDRTANSSRQSGTYIIENEENRSLSKQSKKSLSFDLEEAEQRNGSRASKKSGSSKKSTGFDPEEQRETISRASKASAIKELLDNSFVSEASGKINYTTVVETERPVSKQSKKSVKSSKSSKQGSEMSVRQDEGVIERVPSVISKRSKASSELKGSNTSIRSTQETELAEVAATSQSVRSSTKSVRPKTSKANSRVSMRSEGDENQDLASLRSQSVLNSKVSVRSGPKEDELNESFKSKSILNSKVSIRSSAEREVKSPSLQSSTSLKSKKEEELADLVSTKSSVKSVRSKSSVKNSKASLRSEKKDESSDESGHYDTSGNYVKGSSPNVKQLTESRDAISKKGLDFGSSLSEAEYVPPTEKSASNTEVKNSKTSLRSDKSDKKIKSQTGSKVSVKEN